jgi:hypothetical protein
VDRSERSEIDDAIDVCLQLHTVLHWLRRNTLLGPIQDRRLIDRVQWVCVELEAKIYDSERSAKGSSGLSGSEE